MRGVLVIRWCILAWIVVLAVGGVPAFPNPVLRVGAPALVAGWTVALTLVRPRWTARWLAADLTIAGILVVVGAVVPRFATVYPVTAALTWGAVRGVTGGAGAGAVLGGVLIVAHVLLGTPMRVDGGLVDVTADTVNFVLAGGGVGFVSVLLDRAAADLRRARASEVAVTERAARLAERESLGRQIHDSVLQVLALVHKRGRELAARDPVPGEEVGRLAELAAAQERTLRALIVRPPDADDGDDATTTASLRARLEQAADAAGDEVTVQVSATGVTRLPAAVVRELGAAVDQALHNVGRHAGATHAWVFAEEADKTVVVTVRDDGRGFVFDEAALRAAHKYGLLRSIRGRVEQLGGTLTIETAPGRGTELELRVPRPAADGVEP